MTPLVERHDALENDQSNPTGQVAVELMRVSNQLTEEKSVERSFNPQRCV